MSNIKKIVITGPESSGKSTLTEQLAIYYNSEFIPEYARTYIEKLNRKYLFEDVVRIAERQIKDFNKQILNTKSGFIFFDTGLIITKVWFEYVFGEVPDFLEEALMKNIPDCCLLCYPDLPWKKDSVRENGGKIRFELFNRYKAELEKYNYKYFIIKGSGDTRLNIAKKHLSSAYCL